MHIFLLGVMGVGKSTVGRALSNDLGWRFVDSDAAIEAREGKSVADIFASQGEPAFRDMETHFLESLRTEPTPCVVATGGGMVVREGNRLLMAQQGYLVLLEATLATLESRLAGEIGKRPLLSAGDWRARLKTLRDSRQALYHPITIRIPTDHKEVPEIVAAIKESLPSCCASDTP